jgi:glycosyltransferase involved in cell wall biosynthesis
MVSLVRSAPIEVVIPTYNGSSYLKDQVASIYDQTVRPEHIVLRDDGSTDGTAELILKLCSLYGSWIKVLPTDGKLGAKANFNRLLESTTMPYVALAPRFRKVVTPLI